MEKVGFAGSAYKRPMVLLFINLVPKTHNPLTNKNILRYIRIYNLCLIIGLLIGLKTVFESWKEMKFNQLFIA